MLSSRLPTPLPNGPALAGLWLVVFTARWNHQPQDDRGTAIVARIPFTRNCPTATPRHRSGHLPGHFGNPPRHIRRSPTLLHELTADTAVAHAMH